MLDYGALEAVAAVIREESFDRAAVALGVTPSAISQRVRGLEERVGAILITRGQPCRPTAIGNRLCAHIEQVKLMESDVASMLPGLAAIQGAEGRTIRVAVNADSLNSWFSKAAAAFAWETGALLDLVIEDEEHSAQRLRDGDVLAVVTSDPEPVQGCRTIPLGAMRYLATASPNYIQRFFANGIDGQALNRAPTLRFDRRDALQSRWALEAVGVALDAPTHWIPATQAFLDLSIAGLGWAMNPESLTRPHVAAGRLVELLPDTALDVALYWQVTRIGATLLSRLTETVRNTAREALVQG